uniref:Methyltransferase n=1 Tax=viral metagenome TaxID=1070528 RepID=A0A6M3X8W7_9ZZZZ
MKWLKADPQARIEYSIEERPLLHACSGQDKLFGDVTIDIDPRMQPDIVADITRKIPYPDDSFAAAFADFPWTAAFKRKVANAMKELLRVAPVVYTISPWTYGSSKCTLEWVKVAWQPGVNQALLFSKYVRNESIKSKSLRNTTGVRLK